MDLDNTLWGGVIGEDLLHGIRIGAPSAEGEGYLELQKYVKQLQERGVLLAVCSKNNQADAELPFREHDAMHLKLADFAAFAASWQDKPTSLAAVADELSLGLESVVFLDDNPIEAHHDAIAAAAGDGAGMWRKPLGNAGRPAPRPVFRECGDLR